ncbi:acetyl-CoA synthetase [Nocardioides daedukensis]|uniref:Acetyl-CoA synthetase n=1 Tax=Nocardioides daedukensis TaxID=634462 RepID=A0A7Y9URJ9_9ACTN|nr:AMP-binding protein [Nocardioides daedukensis]NYG59831.1 acetyl-CoA synthetase [Nocardioides daedukensis]
MTPDARPEVRVAELLATFDAADVDLGALLCDDHPADGVAFTVVQPDLTRVDISYGDLSERSRRFAAFLAAEGVRPGDRVATLMGKSADLAGVVMGIWRAGAVHVPLFTAFAPPAIGLRLGGSEAKFVVADADQVTKLAPGEDLPENPAWQVLVAGQGATAGRTLSDVLAQADPEAAPQVSVPGSAELIRLFTSGTTGTPKGVPIPVKALATFVVYLEYGLDVTAEDVYWNAADPGWAYGLYYGIAAPLAAGRRNVLLQAKFTPETTWKVIQELGVTNLAAAPTVFRSLRSAETPAPEGLELRRISSAGEPLNPDVVNWGADVLGAPIHDTYGQTELGMSIVNGWHPDVAGEMRHGSMGRAMPGWTATVLKDDADEVAAPGELGRVVIDLANSPLMWFTGYVDAPEKTAERFSADGRWYYTGDAGTMDEDGYLFFSARDDDVIIMAGYRIGPFEVESVLVGDTRVQEAAVVGVPDELRGEVLEAFVVLAPGQEGGPELVESLKQRVKTKLAAHAYPRQVHIIGELPKTPSGKIQRFQLRSQRAAEVAANPS